MIRQTLLPLALLLAAAATTALAGPVETFDDLVAREWAFRMAENPEEASGNGLEGHGDRLTRVGPEDLARRNAYWKSVLAELDEIDCRALGRAGCIDYRMFRRQIEHFVREYELGAQRIPFNSDWGFWMSWARLPDTTTFRDADDYRDYLARLEMLPAVMDEYIALMREGLATGMTQPRAVLDGRDVSIANHVVDGPRDSAFFAPFERWPDAVPAAERGALTARAEAAIAGGVVPAYAKLLAFFRDEYLPGARETLGASAMPNGEALYREAIRWYATVDLSPAEIHDIGLAEVRRIRGEMEAIIAEVGFEGSFADFIDFLRTDPQFYAKTPRELLAEASYHAKRIDGRLPKLFGKLPRQPYGVAPVPDEIAPFYTTGRAVGAPLNADHGGYYWVNTWALDKRPLYTLPALTLHEAAPGHLMQGALALELEAQPPFRRYDYISAFGEGWALYAEKLGLELDIYETPYQQFGRLTYEMWRACRLVIDTGVHAMGWSREQAQRLLAENSALSLHNVTTEVDRYISWPGQALSYKLGELKFVELRRLATETLGAGFDVKAFHDFVLSLGSVPLDVLEDETRRWVEAQRS